MELVDTLISIGGVALTIAVAWWLGRGRARTALDAHQAMAVAEEALVGFEAERAFVDAGGRGALVAGRDGRAALLKAHGDHWTARVVPPGTHATRDGADLIVALPEVMFGAVRLSVGDGAAQDLAAKIGS